jgi:phage tail-like protein
MARAASSCRTIPAWCRACRRCARRTLRRARAARRPRAAQPSGRCDPRLRLGNGRESPEIVAIRAYARALRTSAALPEIYRDESVFDRSLRGAATRHDFFERFIDLFESDLTRWEDLAADAHVLTHPASCPDASLPWLASFTGLRTPPALPHERTRAWLASGPERARRRGARSGLQLALDVASGGEVSRGAIVVVEDYRLRRTVATLLGVDMERDDDPLLPGLISSGNSFVGDTLILGDETVEREFAAFRPKRSRRPSARGRPTC